MNRLPFAVRHRDGWCEIADQSSPEEYLDNVRTKCGYVVVLPFGIARREPTCKECARTARAETQPASMPIAREK